MRSVVPPLLVLAVVGGALVAADPAPLAPEHAHATTRRAATGTRHGDTVTVQLEARPADWHPAGDDAPGAVVPAFAEVGHAAEIPGPMVRVPAGTLVVVRLRNALPDTLAVHGLHDRPTRGAARVPRGGVRLAPGATRTLAMRLEAPGSYWYWGTTTAPRARGIGSAREATPLTGVLVVDPPPAP
jgi:FtsP/CotA-like multicopper oxidase with cupredoxin domain